jgi:alkanesulfonate monooxygenase SsuD/methylene tetrahydromethanopterin reductase-like flavin-dependent oxidoreductase (luciferase family)
VNASRRPALGFVVRPELAPEKLSDTARSVENAGFDELWLWEDCFLAGGIAAAATALAATATIRVGLGILPAPVRNPAFAAMELAALARMHPGRLHAGFGHGVTDWMRQIGAKPESQVTLLEETVAAVRALLAGEEVHAGGRYVHLDGVRLDHPPDEPPPISCGVRRERSLAVSGRAADGTILSEGGPVEYIEWAKEQIAATRPHRLTVYTWWGEDREAVHAAAAARRPEGGPHARALGDDPDWFERVAVTGDAEQCAARIRRLADAGADAVVLVPPGPDAPPPVAALGY